MTTYTKTELAQINSRLATQVEQLQHRVAQLEAQLSAERVVAHQQIHNVAEVASALNYMHNPYERNRELLGHYLHTEDGE